MYQLHRLVTWIMILVSPARLVAALPMTMPVQAQAHVATPAPFHLELDTSHVSPITVTVSAQPNIDTEVLAPLRAAQADEAQQATEAQAKAEAEEAAKAAEAAKAKEIATKPVVIGGDDAFAQLRYCEAGGDYTRNSGNGYYGAYQYSISTWNNFGGYARADLAPASVQDDRVHADVARNGWRAWPACARKLGLM